MSCYVFPHEIPNNTVIEWSENKLLALFKRSRQLPRCLTDTALPVKLILRNGNQYQVILLETVTNVSINAETLTLESLIVQQAVQSHPKLPNFSNGLEKPSDCVWSYRELLLCPEFKKAAKWKDIDQKSGKFTIAFVWSINETVHSQYISMERYELCAKMVHWMKNSEEKW